MSATKQKTNIKKKRSLTKNEPAERRGVLGPAIEAAFRSLDYPYEQFSQKPNPFVDELRRNAFQKLITIISQYGDECADYYFWNFKEKPLIREKVESLNLERRKVNDILAFLIPKKSLSIRKSAALRLLEFVPEFLVEWVERYRYKMKIYDQTSKNKIKGRVRKDKEEAIKEFWKQTFINNKYPRKRFLDSRSERNIALSFVAYFSGCSYDALEHIYKEVPPEKKKK